MNATDDQHDPWKPCPPGEFERLAARLSARRRRRLVKNLATAGVVLVLLGFGGYQAARWIQGPAEYRFGSIACNQVQRLMPEYRAGRLDPDLRRRVSVHLEECPRCGPAYRRSRPPGAMGALSALAAEQAT